ncbi:GGDEF domain-containing protein [Aureimonas sp. N4]|uniref:GGDEF domain-containing protein n=1 Tax=Aureimonas sp. N4 TaxID=1638165 RepID=UPI0007802BB8|nr:GGDEF domain-containing protein [Aureimonas sp. N4]
MTKDAAPPLAPAPGLSPDDILAIFDCAPTSLWVQDLSLLKARLDQWRAGGIRDLRALLALDAARVEELVPLVRIVSVNAETLRLYDAADEADLFAHIRVIFGPDQIASFVEVICQLWDGALRASLVTRNYTVKGLPFDVSYNGRLLPGHETGWGRYLISVEDVSDREQARRQLEFARTHDPLSGLFNRTFLTDEMERLETCAEPVAIAVIDLNGLKDANDHFGHKAGDDLIRKMGRVLSTSLPACCRSARMGGDEFVVLVQGAGKGQWGQLLDALTRGVEAENASGGVAPLNFSIGAAWRMPGETMESLLARADRRMYRSKRAFYDEVAA